MESDQLSSIIGQEYKEPDFIQDVVDVEEAKPKPITEGFVCPTCNKSFKTQLALTGHSRTHNKGKLKDTSEQIPTSQSYLEELLTGYNVPSRNGILLSIKDDPDNINELREALKSVRVDKNTADYIIKKYANSIGKNIPETGLPAHKEPEAIDDILARKKKEADMRMYDSYIQAGQNNGSKNNPELEQMRLQIAQMQESNRQLQQQIQSEKLQNELNMLKEQNRQIQENYRNEIGGLGSTLKDFTQSLTNSIEKQMLESDNKFEKLRLEMKHQQEMNEMKKQVAEATNSKPYQEKVLDKTEALINNVAAGTAGIFDKSLKSQESLERANASMGLAQAGFSPQQITEILNPQTHRPVINPGDSRREWEALQRATQTVPEPRIQMDTKPPEPQKPIAEDRIVGGTYPEIPIKFNVAD